jgi:hypothetical protein
MKGFPKPTSRLPSYYDVVYYGEATVPFSDIFWQLGDAKHAVSADMEARFDGDEPYEPHRWRKTAVGSEWSYDIGDVSYTIRRVDPVAKP